MNTEKILKRFYINKPYPLISPMVIRSLDVKKICPPGKGEELLCPEILYFNAIGALTYLVNCT